MAMTKEYTIHNCRSLASHTDSVALLLLYLDLRDGQTLEIA